MSWICPRCHSENYDICIDGIRIRCMCGYDPVTDRTEGNVEYGWELFLWACPQEA